MYRTNTPTAGGGIIATSLKRFEIAVPLKLAALWAAALGCYVYGDLLSHWVPGAQARMDAGDMGPLGTVTPGLLAGIAAFMSVPALMIALSVLLPATTSRWLNVVLGALYSLLVGASLLTAAPFYLYLSGVSVILTAAIAWLAWRWPKAAAA